MSNKARREAIGLKMSDSYIRNLKMAEHLSHWREKKRPELTSLVAAVRPIRRQRSSRNICRVTSVQ